LGDYFDLFEMTTPSAPILASIRDWDVWYEVAKTKALQLDVWDRVNPDSDAIPDLVEPLLPLPKDVNPEKLRYSTLTADEKEELLVLREQHKRDLRSYDRQKRGLIDMRVYIQGSVGTDAPWDTIVGKDTAKGMLVALRGRFSPTTEERERVAREDYIEMQQKGYPRSQGIEQWLDRWRKVWTMANRHSLPEVQGLHSHEDFIRAVSDSYEAWATLQDDKIHSPDYKEDFLDLVERFRRFLLGLGKSGKPKPWGGFVATLRSPEDCVCGGTHRFVGCPYLAKDAREPGWVPDAAVKEAIQKKLDKYDTLRGKVQRMVNEGNLQPIGGLLEHRHQALEVPMSA